MSEPQALEIVNRRYPYDPNVNVAGLFALEKLRAVRERTLAAQLFELYAANGFDEAETHKSYEWHPSDDDNTEYGRAQREPEKVGWQTGTFGDSDWMSRNNQMYLEWERFTVRIDLFSRAERKRTGMPEPRGWRSEQEHKFSRLMASRYDGQVKPADAWSKRIVQWKEKDRGEWDMVRDFIWIEPPPRKAR